MRIKIANIDRRGLVFDISKILYEHRLNIVSMEVEKNMTYLETEPVAKEKEQAVADAIGRIENVTDVTAIGLMPHEEKLRQLQVVLDTVTDGIVSIDDDGIIKQYNPAAGKILHTSLDQAIGKKLLDVLPCCSSLLESIQKGAKYVNREIFFEQTGSHYLVNSHPVLDKENHIIGGVAVLKDIQDVRKFYQRLTEQPSFDFDRILHASKVMEDVISQAKRYAAGESTILIRGETGTGKELFARALHAASPRRQNIFLTVNCAAIPDTLLESELFGYEEGAFTGASKGGKQGLFELANEGTLFLDEIGEMSSHLQAKLLRVLQEHKVRRIGGRREVPLNVRMLAATNRNLEEMIKEGDFRKDLYYRLNVIPLFLPSLRERKEDVALLAESFLRRFAANLGRGVKSISAEALEVLRAYDWPGNIRELENIMERAANIVKGDLILPEHIIFGRYADHTPAQAIPFFSQGKSLGDMLNAAEKNILSQALRHYHTSRKLGGALGLSHTSVLKKMRKHGLLFTQNKK